MAQLISGYDSLLLDLDGVVYLGNKPVKNAVFSILAVHSMGLKVGYVTNNASRTQESMAAQLVSFGLPATSSSLIGSARAGAKMLLERIDVGEKVLVVGGEGLRVAVSEAGFEIVDSYKQLPRAVIQGFNHDVSWDDLAEASYAIQNGAIWIATNQDWTIPKEDGIAPGNGTLVSAVHTAVGILPEVAGKPFAPIFLEAISQLDVSNPLFVGDRLDTDIRGANNFGIDSACVMTGIASRKELLGAKAEDRPKFILADLSELLVDYPKSKKTKYGVRVNRTEVELLAGKVLVSRGDPSSLDALRAASELIWNCGTPIYALDVEPALFS
jgi:HAD superfamily hydrolase (TIGR01450 family)